jgi:small-conductance mechanosensitive channel
MILFYRPFHRNDRIKMAEFEGVVAEINLRYTIIARADSRVLIPNSNLLVSPIVVWNSPATDTSSPSGQT